MVPDRVTSRWPYPFDPLASNASLGLGYWFEPSSGAVDRVLSPSHAPNGSMGSNVSFMASTCPAGRGARRVAAAHRDHRRLLRVSVLLTLLQRLAIDGQRELGEPL